MPDFPFGAFSSPNPTGNSWFARVRENFGQLFVAARFSASSANGAPLHLLKSEKSPRARRAQSVSLAIHAAVITLLALLAIHPPSRVLDRAVQNSRIFSPIPIPEAIWNGQAGAHPSAGSGSGGDENPLPATHGNLPTFSSLQLVKPTLPDQREHLLPVPPTILDLTAAPVLTSVDQMGLPWMRDGTNSQGPGPGHTLGNKGGDSIGDSGTGPVGFGGAENTPYGPGVTEPRCVYCPDPKYTDQAREAKLQGSVTLQVLVGADGRAAQIRVVRGLGMGLDDRTVQIVQGWRFTPAHDASHHAVAAWVTIEAVYRLF
jgi:periplasmic protein TonB